MHSLTVGQIWNELSTIRFGFFSGREAEYRARPLFFCYWLLETALFGDHPYFYYIVRIFYFGIFLGSLIWLATPTLGIIVATLATVLFALQVFWAQIWVYSLGVLEQIAVLGFAITVIGYGNLISDWVRGNSRASRGIVSVSVGTAIAAGCKENFLFLLFPLAVTLLALYSRRRLALTDFVISLLFLSFPLISLIRVLYLFMTISVDAYGADSSLGHRIHILIASPLFVIFKFSSWS